jgi:hypothetical protein
LFGPHRKRRGNQLAKIQQTRIARRRRQRLQQRVDSSLDGCRQRRRWRRAVAEKSLATRSVESFDQRLGAERGLDWRQSGEARRLQEIRDEVIDVAFADAPIVGGAKAADVVVERRGGDTPCRQLRVKRTRVGPRNPL